MFKEGDKLIGDTPDEMMAFYFGLGIGILVGLQLMLILIAYYLKKKGYKPPFPPTRLKNSRMIVSADGTKKDNKIKTITGTKETSPETIPPYHTPIYIAMMHQTIISQIAIIFPNTLIRFSLYRIIKSIVFNILQLWVFSVKILLKDLASASFSEKTQPITEVSQ